MTDDNRLKKKRGPSGTRMVMDLRGRQSVRATFKLSVGCIEALSIVATQMGIKQKSLFDHLLEDHLALRELANELQDQKIRMQDRVQKTFVISRKTLTSLEDISKRFNAPRDALVEFSVQRLIPIINRERARYAKRKQVNEEIKRHLRAGERLLEKVEAELGKEDPFYERLLAVMSVYAAAQDHMDAFVERGKSIEDFYPQFAHSAEPDADA